jgi:hypothetical protein
MEKESERGERERDERDQQVHSILVFERIKRALFFFFNLKLDGRARGV